MEDITNADYAHAKIFAKDFYVQSGTVVLIYLKTLEICVLKYTNLFLQDFFPELAWKAALKKTRVKLDLATIAFNLLYAKKEKIYPACVSTNNSDR